MSETLYKWDMIPAGYDYAACNEKEILAFKHNPIFSYGEWSGVVKKKGDFMKRDIPYIAPLSVLNRLPGKPSETLEKRPGVQNG